MTDRLWLLLGGGGFCALAAGLFLSFGALSDRLAPDRQPPTAASVEARPNAAVVLFAAGEAPVEQSAIAELLLRPSAAPLLYPRQASEMVTDSTLTFDGVRYDDPTGGGVPLQLVRGANQWITPGFRLRDFAARDGAPLARISPELVQGLERLRRRVGELVIISGYRHPSHNLYVGGAGDSQHQAGKAADIFAPGFSPVELAVMALEEMGCNLGLGLGATSLHVDVRGELATWTYEGAAARGPAFAVLVRTQCGLPVPGHLARRAEAVWLQEAAIETGEAAPAARSGPAAGGSPLERHEGTLMAHAASMYPSLGPGAVLLDLRPESGGLRYVTAGDPALRELGLDGLVAFCQARRDAGCFAYAILDADREPLTGVMSMAAGTSRPATAPGFSEPAVAAPLPEPATGRWGIVVASTPDEARAHRDAEHHRAQLAARSQAEYPVHVVPREGGYRVVVGGFGSRREASAALARLRSAVPADAWVLGM